MITKGQERCLYVFTPEEFEGYVRTARQSVPNTATGRALMRQLLAATDEQRPDGQGRIAILQELRRYAGLDRDCVVLGMDNHLEIWASSAWEDYVSEHEESYAQAQGEVLPSVF